MLSVAAIGSSGAASSYYTKDNYYTADAAQETSLWAGDGAEKAGLSGEVGIEAFKAILDGKMHPSFACFFRLAHSLFSCEVWVISGFRTGHKPSRKPSRRHSPLRRLRRVAPPP